MSKTTIDDLILYRKAPAVSPDSDRYLAATIRICHPLKADEWVTLHAGDFRKDGESEVDFKARLKKLLLEGIANA